MNIKAPIALVLSMILFSLLLIGCEPAAGVLRAAAPTAIASADTPQPGTAIPPTETEQPSATPLPATATSTMVPTKTRRPTSDVTATIEAEQTALDKIVNDAIEDQLKGYGVNPSDGEIVWIQTDPIRLEINGYMEDKNWYLDDLGSLSDFVIETLITWDTSGGLSLCGFTFRADEDKELGAQNRLFIERLQFAPGWTIWGWEYGQFQFFLPGDWVPSRSIHDKNGSSNVVALVARGKNLEVYINHDKQTLVQDNHREQGLLALSATHESGDTICTFDYSWVWAFGK